MEWEDGFQRSRIADNIAEDITGETDEETIIVNPGTVDNIALNGSTLSWGAKNMSVTGYNLSNIPMRYAVYAIPLNTGANDAKSTIHTNDGGYKADYLLDITYNNITKHIEKYIPVNPMRNYEIDCEIDVTSMDTLNITLDVYDNKRKFDMNYNQISIPIKLENDIRVLIK